MGYGAITSLPFCLIQGSEALFPPTGKRLFPLLVLLWPVGSRFPVVFALQLLGWKFQKPVQIANFFFFLFFELMLPSASPPHEPNFYVYTLVDFAPKSPLSIDPCFGKKPLDRRGSPFHWSCYPQEADSAASPGFPPPLGNSPGFPDCFFVAGLIVFFSLTLGRVRFSLFFDSFFDRESEEHFWSPQLKSVARLPMASSLFAR